MAYNKISNKTQDKDVKYLSKDYNSFKNQLIGICRKYFIFQIILMILVKEIQE